MSMLKWSATIDMKNPAAWKLPGFSSSLTPDQRQKKE
jgi:hypothetical protein